MKNIRRITMVLASVMGAIALFVANTGVGTNCYGLLCQPKFPEKLQK